MYEDNRNEGFDGNGSPDNHRAEETTPNFVMKDTPSSEPSQPRDGYGQQPYSPMNQNSQQGAYGGNPGQMDNRQPFGGYQNQQNQAVTGYQMANGQNGPDSGADNSRKKSGKHRGMASKVAGITAAALLFGVVSGGTMVGVNKIAPDYEKALWRARNIASPKNAQRLGRKTPCAAKGDRCYDCQSPERICRALVTLWQKPTGVEKAEVVLVEEELGY